MSAITALMVLGFSPVFWRPSTFATDRTEYFLADVDLDKHLPRELVGGNGTDLWTHWERQECSDYKTLLLLSWVPTRYDKKAYFTPDYLGRRGFPLLPCPETCIRIKTTDNRRLLRWADVVVFNFLWGPQPYDLPPRPPGTIYVYTSMEPPPIEARPNSYLLKQFNFFWSYRRDLPMSSTYLNMMNLTFEELQKPPHVAFHKKSKTPVATLITNCKAHSGRREFNEELMRHIPIHNYGSCLQNKRPPRRIMRMEKEEAKEKMEFVMAKYKFVFAIENSLCTDYVSEKLGRALRFGMVPIVASLNGSLPDYGKITPDRHTVFNVMEFKTVKDVAERLKEIANDEELYNSFFAYRKQNPEQWPWAFQQALNAKNHLDGSPLCRLSVDFFKRKERARMTRQTVSLAGEVCAQERTLKHHFNIQSYYHDYYY